MNHYVKLIMKIESTVYYYTPLHIVNIPSELINKHQSKYGQNTKGNVPSIKNYRTKAPMLPMEFRSVQKISKEMASQGALDGRVSDFAQHEYGIGVALDNGEQKGPVHCELQRDSPVLCLSGYLGSLLRHLKHHLAEHLQRIFEYQSVIILMCRNKEKNVKET